MDWIHCNRCFRKIDKSLKYFIKECGRIECQKCLKPTGEGVSDCVICHKSCRTIVLANDMKPEVQIFFKSIPNLLDNVKKVYEFQMKNHNNLFNHSLQKYSRAKNEIEKCYKLIDTYKKDNEKLKTLLKGNHFSTPMGRFSTSTPLQQSSSPSIFNGSLSTLTSTPQNPNSKPGFALRVSPGENRSCSAMSSLERVVPGSGQSSIVPTHRGGLRTPRTPSVSLMAQLMQNSSQARSRRR